MYSSEKSVPNAEFEVDREVEEEEEPEVRVVNNLAELDMLTLTAALLFPAVVVLEPNGDVESCSFWVWVWVWVCCESSRVRWRVELIAWAWWA